MVWMLLLLLVAFIDVKSVADWEKLQQFENDIISFFFVINNNGNKFIITVWENSKTGTLSINQKYGNMLILSEPEKAKNWCRHIRMSRIWTLFFTFCITLHFFGIRFIFGLLFQYYTIFSQKFTWIRIGFVFWPLLNRKLVLLWLGHGIDFRFSTSYSGF